MKKIIITSILISTLYSIHSLSSDIPSLISDINAHIEGTYRAREILDQLVNDIPLHVTPTLPRIAIINHEQLRTLSPEQVDTVIRNTWQEINRYHEQLALWQTYLAHILEQTETIQ